MRPSASATLAAVDVARALTLVSCILLLPTPARADVTASRLVPELASPFRPSDKGVESAPDGDPWSNRPRQVNFQGGSTGGPLGYGGLSFEYAPSRYFVAGAGAGWSGSGPTGAVMPRLRLPVTRWFAFGFGVPFSIGPYQYAGHEAEACQVAGCATNLRTTRTWDIAYWGHLEPNIEFRAPNGLGARFYVGYSQVLNPHDDRCESSLPRGCPSRLGEAQTYGGVALGYSF